MIRLKRILLESACPFPAAASETRAYLTALLQSADTTPEVFAVLNSARSSWTDAEATRAISYGACELWNILISSVLDNKGIVSQVYEGKPHDPHLPTHYYCSVGNTIIDFVVGQFWGYGLGAAIDDPDRATFSHAEYSDILDAYQWTLV